MKKGGLILVVSLVFIFCLTNLSFARRAKGNLAIQEVYTAMNRIIDNPEENPVAKLEAAICLYNAGKKEEAEEFIKNFDSDANPIYKAWQARAYSMIGEGEKAAQLVEEVRRLNNPKADRILEEVLAHPVLQILNGIDRLGNSYARSSEEKMRAINRLFNLLKGALPMDETIENKIYATLKTFAQDHDFNVKIHLIHQIGENADSAMATSLLLQLTQDDNWQVRWESYMALTKIVNRFNTRGVERVVFQLMNKDMDNRQVDNFQDMLRPLNDLLEPDFSISSEVIKNLKQIKNTDGIFDEESIVRLEIVELLFECGLFSDDAKDMLKNLALNDVDSGVKELANKRFDQLSESTAKAREDLRVFSLGLESTGRSIPGELPDYNMVVMMGAAWLVNGPAELRDGLINIAKRFSHENSKKVEFIFSFLGERKDDVAKEFLISSIKNDALSPGNRNAAILALAHQWWMDDGDVRSVLADSINLNRGYKSYDFAVAYELIKFGGSVQKEKAIRFFTKVAQDNTLQFFIRKYAFSILQNELRK